MRKGGGHAPWQREEVMKDLVSHARDWAIEKHGLQRYGNSEDSPPYAYHLGAVAAIAAPYGELAETVAWLHDVIEDTPTTEEDVAAEFGDQMARFVKFLTDEKVKDKAEKVRRRNEKLAALSGVDTVALVVKAADRLANLRESIKPGEKSEKMIVKYGGEHLGLRAAAYRPGLCDPIWSELDAIVERLRSG